MNLLEDIYIGSYTDNKKQTGVYDIKNKNLVVNEIKVGLVNPSFILTRNKLIYSVEETNQGRLNVIDSQQQLIRTVQTFGNDPCHISINERGNRLVVTNYSSATFIMYELTGLVPSRVSSYVKHEGSSINPDRQSSPHPHCSVFSEDDQILFVSDLGTDIVYYYTVVYGGQQSLVCEKDKCLKITGCGPRHLTRGQSGQNILYLSCQLDSTIRTLSYASGKLEQLSAYRVSNNPTNYPSQISYYNGNVMMANRGDDNVIVFSIHSKGQLKQKFRFKVGHFPRHFKISKQGLLYVACQKGNEVQIFRVESQKVLSIGSVKLNTPSCIAFEE